MDDNWHITSLVDLEWACSRPIEMLQTPTWLTNKAVDEITDKAEEYDKMRTEFMDILVTEEEQSHDRHALADKTRLSTVMAKGWEMGTFWYSLALISPTGLLAVFYKQIQPRFRRRRASNDDDDEDPFGRVMPWYWSQDFIKVGAQKIV